MNQAFRRSRFILFLLITLFGCKQPVDESRIDKDPPRVVRVWPLPNSVNVEVDSVIIVEFSEEIQGNSVVLIVQGSNGEIAGELTIERERVHWQPLLTLAYSTTYRATVKAGVKDLAGNAMKEDYSWTFTTENAPVVPDTIPPTVVSTVPPNGAQNVAVMTTIVVNFSEAVVVPPQGFKMTKGDLVISGTPVSSGSTFKFTPKDSLDYNSTYTCTLTTAVTDTAGNHLQQNFVFSFTTEKEPDVTPPQVVSTNPQNGATGVEREVVIRVVFSEEVNVPTDAFSLKDENNNFVPGSQSIAGAEFTFTPQDPLTFNTTYTATITTAVTDLSGNHLPQDFTFSFAVKPDDISPEVLETYPTDGDTGVAKDTDIWVKFSEPIDPASVNATTFAVSGADGNVNGNYMVDNDTARFVPDSLDWQTTYTVTLSGITDLAGNPMSTYSFSFTTQADTTPRWINPYGGMKRLAITDEGYIYTLAAGPDKWVVMKFNPDGRIVWFKGLPEYAYYSRDIAVYSGGGQDEVYVLTAQYDPMGGAPSNITKLDGSGNIVWTSPDFTSNAFKLEVGEDGRLFIPNGRLYEFSTTDGSVVHIQDIGTNNSKILSVVAFADFIYVGGETFEDLFGTAVSSDWFIAKYDANYNLIWGVQFNGPDSAAEFVGAVAVDRVNNIVYIGGGYGKGMSWVYDGIASYNDNGNSASFLWFQRVTNNTSVIGDDGTRMVAYNGSVYYGNSVHNTPVKVLSDGTIDWNMTSNGVEDFVFYNGKMYVLFPYPRSNKIYIFDADTGAPLN
ncbi:MAG: hypothetical protein GXO78_06445 [Calditrichaeota bacterium]|nr:hypothetical protein [Calditrichota bacterium]